MMSTVSGRIPASVESRIHSLMDNYSQNLTAVLSQFPSQKVRHASTPDCLVSAMCPLHDVKLLSFRSLTSLTDTQRVCREVPTRRASTSPLKEFWASCRGQISLC